MKLDAPSTLAATNIAFSTWMMTSYFKTIPVELDEAARVDGASSFMIFRKIILPLTVPGIAAVAIFVLINGWNEYMYSSVLISKDSLKTLTVGIVALNTQNPVSYTHLVQPQTLYTKLESIFMPSWVCITSGWNWTA